jgi:hypothetical protein
MLMPSSAQRCSQGDPPLLHMPSHPVLHMPATTQRVLLLQTPPTVRTECPQDSTSRPGACLWIFSMHEAHAETFERPLSQVPCMLAAGVQKRQFHLPGVTFSTGSYPTQQTIRTARSTRAAPSMQMASTQHTPAGPQTSMRWRSEPTRRVLSTPTPHQPCSRLSSHPSLSHTWSSRTRHSRTQSTVRVLLLQ